MSEWKTQPIVHVVKWSLTQTICSNFHSDCWNIDADLKRNTTEMIVPSNLQLCPLQLQLGDSLFLSSEPSFQSYGMNLANVSLEEFMRCPQEDVPQKELIFGCRLRGMHQIDPKWLETGTRYFVEAPARGPPLCNLGLRLNITVKQHFCQQSPSAPFCSGHGKCLSHIWDKAYHCICNQPYSGQFCQESDVCFSKPCYNNASCVSRGKQRDRTGDSYECICPPLFAGKNCSEIIGQCQPQSCHHGNCSNVTPNTHQCQCDKDFSGKECIYCNTKMFWVAVALHGGFTVTSCTSIREAFTWWFIFCFLSQKLHLNHIRPLYTL
ncbi:protein eyes shut homolog [Eublepharis macularius]|uniref:Protein eyes shut homolog n=1 Tax=Eublepharis macularius TaxID=481883 RepID=A0AA97IX87_EUBMA|nr:protein eyes shut homolog [Eublepharis macularius]